MHLFLLCTLGAAVSAFHQPNDAMLIPTTRLAFPRLLRESVTPRTRKISHHYWRRKGNIADNDVPGRLISTSTKQLASTSGWIAKDWANISPPIHQDGRHYRVATYSDLVPTPSPQRPSPVECIMVRDRIVYIKRDDLLRLDRSGVSGNKARKFLALNELDARDFPDVIVSYGGPQSNAMVALAAIVNSKNLNNHKQGGRSESEPSGGKRKRFVYYTKKLPRWLRNQPSGNFLRAMSLGMELVELSPNRYADLFGGESGGSFEPPQDLEPPVTDKIDGNGDTTCLWVPQGGACGIARQGARVLAEEIIEFWQRNGKGSPLAVCVPGGTCSSALLLDREIKAIQKKRRDGASSLDIKVVVVPCVGDDEYAKRQMSALDMSIGGNTLDLPAVLKPKQQTKSASGKRSQKSNGYFKFGTPDVSILQTYNEMMNEYGLFLDLLYGAPAWNIMLQHWSVSNLYTSDENPLAEDDYPISGRQVMYVHSGGLEGIASQMTRYKHQGMVDSANVQ